MALLDMFDGMNIFAAKPSEALTGILTDADKEKLKNQSLIQGLLGAGATYLAQPKNQNIGLGAILGKSYLGGMQQAQGSYDSALKSKIDALGIAKTQKQIEMEGMTDPQKLLKGLNELNTNSPTYTQDKEYLKAALDKATSTDNSFIKTFEYAKSHGFAGTPEDWQKLIIQAQQSYVNPVTAAEVYYKTGINPTPVPQSATMQDVNDTALKSGKTPAQVIQDLKSKGIKIKG